jgi:hypothetical protein
MPLRAGQGHGQAHEQVTSRDMTLDIQDHQALALWAADCAAHVLPVFEEQRPHDDRPRQAIEAARAWARGAIGVGAARTAAFAAHAAAREVAHPAARAAARAAGHAAATAHMTGHARHAAAYARAAASAADPGGADAAAVERDWQARQLAQPLHLVGLPAGTAH